MQLQAVAIKLSNASHALTTLFCHRDSFEEGVQLDRNPEYKHVFLLLDMYLDPGPLKDRLLGPEARIHVRKTKRIERCLQARIMMRHQEAQMKARLLQKHLPWCPQDSSSSIDQVTNAILPQRHVYRTAIAEIFATMDVGASSSLRVFDQQRICYL